MLQKFWETLGTRLAERWAAAAAPALLFWLGGSLAWLHGRGGVQALTQPRTWVLGQPGGIQVGLLVAGLLVLISSALMVERLSLPMLRLLEGYWPRTLQPLRRRLVIQQTARATTFQQRWSHLQERLQQDTASPSERQEAIDLDARLRRFPATPEQIMPTRVGNILRAAESRPRDKYGLDTVACWPHLWLLLPDATRHELATANGRLQACAGAVVWNALFLIFAFWTWWAVPTALVVGVVVIRIWTPDRAEVFADLLEAAVDLHRSTLYKALRWPLPADPDDERSIGGLLSEYLRRGLSGSIPQFTKPEQ